MDTRWAGATAVQCPYPHFTGQAHVVKRVTSQDQYIAIFHALLLTSALFR